MDLYREYLEEKLQKYYKLLKELEDKELYEDDPRRKAKYTNDIEEIKQKIKECNLELQSLQTNGFRDSQTSDSRDNNIAQDSTIELDKQPQTKLDSDKKQYLSLTELASFCAHAFPLLRWMHQPVPSKYVKWYFNKIHEFFIFEGSHIPHGKDRYLYNCVEVFFRCAYFIPSQDFNKELHEIHNYTREKLAVAYYGFMKFSQNFGYKMITYDPEIDSKIFRSNTLPEVFLILRRALSYTLESKQQNIDPLSPAERDIISFMIYIIDFIFEEKRARDSKKNLDLPEGIVLKLFDILNHAFKNYLGVQLPNREDKDQSIDFNSYIFHLSHSWDENLE